MMFDTIKKWYLEFVDYFWENIEEAYKFKNPYLSQIDCSGVPELYFLPFELLDDDDTTEEHKGYNYFTE